MEAKPPYRSVEQIGAAKNLAGEQKWPDAALAFIQTAHFVQHAVVAAVVMEGRRPEAMQIKTSKLYLFIECKNGQQSRIEHACVR